MRWGCRRLGLGLMLAIGLAEEPGCGDSAFACLDDAACQGLEGGMCEASGFCSQVDEACDSGRRYAPHAGMLAGACVAPDGTSTGASATTEATTTTEAGSVSTSGAASGSETTGSQTTSIVEDTTTTADAPTETSDAQSSSSTGGPPLVVYDFEDDFERPDNDMVGNGWREKTDGAFGIVGGSMHRDAAETPFGDNIVYRPGLLLEGVEVHTTFRFLGDEATGLPQVHVRIDEQASEAPGPSTSYLVYMPSGGMNLIRVDAGEFTEIGTVTPDAPLEVGVDYRYRLSISTGAPAMLDAYLDVDDGGTWLQIAEIHGADARPLPAGTVGLSGHSTSFAYAYEHIGWFEI